MVLLIVATAAAEGLEWKLEPSELLRYEKKKSGAKGRGSMVTVHGHDIRDHGHYRPVTLATGDFPAYFGLSTRVGTLRGKLKVREVIRLACRGMAKARALGDDRIEVVATWTFASRGKEEPRDRFRLDDGSAMTTTIFDAKNGAVHEATVTVRYRLVPLDPSKKEKTVDERWTLRFVKRQPIRWKGQRKQINECIDRGAKFLRTLQREEGDFKPHGNHTIGSTALAIMTLHACGVERNDPALRKALDWLLRQSPARNYDRSVALMAFDHVYTPEKEILALRRGKPVAFERRLPDEERAWCHRIAEALERAAPSPGMWDYSSKGAAPGGSRRPDASNSQYAVLGLRAAARLGYPVKEQSWRGVIRYFSQLRERKAKRGRVDVVFEGEVYAQTIKVPEAAGFRYRADGPFAWGSMTCAGIASLAIARDELQRARLRVDARAIDRMIWGGWAWLDAHWGVDRNPDHPGGRWYYYYLYSLERAGILARIKKVGGKDWYLEGAIQLLERERKGGGWGGSLTDNCFALLFLRRATAPVATVTR